MATHSTLLLPGEFHGGRSLVGYSPCGRKESERLHSLTLSAKMSECNSVVSDSLQPHRLQPARLLYPWNSPSKNTGVGCQALFQRILLTQGWSLHLLCPLHWQADILPLSIRKRNAGHEGQIKTLFRKKSRTTKSSKSTLSLEEN